MDLREWDPASKDYDDSLRLAREANDDRGILKVRAGRALSLYFRSPTEKSREEAIAELRDVERSCRGLSPLHEEVEQNLQLLLDGVTDPGQFNWHHIL